MSMGFAQLDIESVEVKLKDVNGMEYVIRMGEPGRRLQVDTALNVEYADDYLRDGILLSRTYRYPERREYTMKVRF